MLLPDLALEIEKQFIFDVTPIWSAPALDWIHSNLRKPAPNSTLGYVTQLLSTKMPFSPSSSPPWRRTWIICSSSKKRTPPPIRRRVLDKYSDPEEEAETFLRNHMDLTITSMPQGRFVTGRALSPWKYSITPASWPTSQIYLINKVDPPTNRRHYLDR